jgi:hypothetical protein
MSDTFRKEYKELDSFEKEQIQEIKLKAEELEKVINYQKSRNKNPRCLALAMTKLEESVMWAVKAITE